MNLKKIKYNILIPLIIFNIISLFAIFAITPNLDTGYSQSAMSFVLKQSTGFIVGYIAIYILYKMDLSKVHGLINNGYYILLIMMFIMAFDIPILHDAFVKNINGANGWWRIIPFYPSSPTIQPVEFMKIAMIFKLALISKEHITSYTSDWVLFRKYILYGMLPILFVLMQPDLGGAMLLGFPWLIMLLLSIKEKKILRIIIITLVLLILTVGLLLFVGQQFLIDHTPIQDYQLERINAWLHPFENSIGLQLQQSMILMGSAGAFGHGFGYYGIAMPEPHTDMIFAMIVGMFGWVFGVLIIGLYYKMINAFINVGLNTYNITYKYMAIGFAALFIIQITENIGMIIGLLPITGIVLPFLSYGVSALITYSLIVGIILNIAKK